MGWVRLGDVRLAYDINSILLLHDREIFCISTCFSHYYGEVPQQLKTTSLADRRTSKVRPIQIKE